MSDKNLYNFKVLVNHLQIDEFYGFSTLTTALSSNVNSSRRSFSGKKSFISFIMGIISSMLRCILRIQFDKSLTVLNCSQYLAYLRCFSTKFIINVSTTKFNLRFKIFKTGIKKRTSKS